MRIWPAALALFCLTLLTIGGSLGARESLPEKTGHLVVFNMYYANPGMADDVLETRRYASVVRDRLGLPRGRVLRRINDSDALPDVIWECEFADVAAHDRDMDARAASDAFEGVRDRMRKLIRRFERTLWRVEDPLSPVALTKAGLSPTAQPPGGIVVTNWYFANAGQRDAVLMQRVHASDVREQLGHPGGRVLDRLVDPVGELPEATWQMDYPSREARRKDAEAIGSTTEFKKVMDHMRTLVRGFERGVWEVQEPLGPDAQLPTP